MSTSIVPENCFLVRNLKTCFSGSLFVFFLLYNIALVFKYALRGHHAIHYSPMRAQMLSRVWLFEIPWTVAHQAPLSMGFLQARILEWGATSFSRRSSRPRNRTWVSCIGRYFLYQGSPRYIPMNSLFYNRDTVPFHSLHPCHLAPTRLLCLFSVSKSFFLLLCVFRLFWFHMLRSYSICLSRTYFT